MCAVAAAGLHSERLRGGRGSPDSQTDPQRSPRLQSCKYASSCGVTEASLSRFLLKQNLLNKLNRIKSSCFGSVNQKNGSVVCVSVCVSCIHLCASWPTCCRWTDLSNSDWTPWPENWPRLPTKSCRCVCGGNFCASLRRQACKELPSLLHSGIPIAH